MRKTGNKKTKKNQSPIPEIGLRWSRKLILVLFVVCIVITTFGVFGFLYYKEYHKQAYTGDDQLPHKILQNEQKVYTNDYWGFKFLYPSFWTSVIGSFEDGDYYFSSEPINFIKELATDQALMEVKTYIDYKKPAFSDWLIDQEQNYFPYGTITSKKPFKYNQYSGMRYIIELKKPVNNTNYWDMIVVSDGDKRMYKFILETSTQRIHDNYKDVFESMVGSLEFYPAFGT